MRIWQQHEIALLGTDTDRAIGRRIGRTEGATRKKRRQIGIAAYCHVASGSQADPQPWTWEELAMLGSATDREIAGRLGRSLAAITAKRIRMEIAPYHEPHGRKATTPRRANPML